VLNHYKTIVVSDIHLGTEGKSLKKLMYFLKKNSCERLILNGDLVKGWQLRKIKQIHKKQKAFLNLLFKMIEKYETEIVFLTGNELFIKGKKNLKFGSISFQSEVVINSGSRKYYVINEDILNQYVLRNWMGQLQSIPYVMAVWINRQYNLLRFGKGKSYHFLFRDSKLYKKIEDLFLKRSAEYAKGLMRTKDCNGIICGHIHKPCLLQMGEKSYFNAGYWNETGMALVETPYGEWKFLSYSETLEADKEAKKHYKIQKRLFETTNFGGKLAVT
jgi:UDP-2,3-diacylglucosamine pyrophosphatase LpxH